MAGEIGEGGVEGGVRAILFWYRSYHPVKSSVG